MKIVQVVHGFLPDSGAGTEIYTYNLAKELNKRHDVYIFCRRKEPGEEEYTIRSYVYDNLPVSSINNNFKKMEDFSCLYENDNINEKFSLFLKELKPDVVHIQHLTCLSISLISVAKSYNIPVVITIPDYWYICQRGQRLKPDLSICSEPMKATECVSCLASQISNFTSRPVSALREKLGLSPLPKLKKFLKKILTNLPGNFDNSQAAGLISERKRRVLDELEKADIIISPSKFLRNEHIKFGVPEGKIIFSDYGFDHKLFLVQRENNKNDKENRSKSPRFGFIGTIIPSKGLHVLIEAFDRMKDDHAELRIYGGEFPYDGYDDYLSNLKRKAKNPGIKFMGGYDNRDIGRVLSEIDVLIVPSIWYENSPLTIHEAFLAKVPVITSNIGGMAELVQDGKNGMLFRAGDPKDLGDKINLFIEHPRMINKLSRGIEHVKTIEESSLELEQIYQRLIEQKTLKEAEWNLYP